MPDTAAHLWRPEHPAGHQPYCVNPGGHSMLTYCSASPDEPATMQGRPSKAWCADHPDAIITTALQRASVDIHQILDGHTPDAQRLSETSIALGEALQAVGSSAAEALRAEGLLG